ncbi:uncharacterized protein LOC110890989 [Helianthus annuus]|uniref:uncharacterized protein LOC110890989 n=1 Tax=Helianthus annuus TaxID=4232 RepID=UPI001652D4D2|nr:uncharacterized protein LOC110890989 [Helianthus annuus]
MISIDETTNKLWFSKSTILGAMTTCRELMLMTRWVMGPPSYVRSRFFLFMDHIPLFNKINYFYKRFYVRSQADLTRVKTRDGIKLLILDNDGKPTDKTTNMVYKEIFNEL